MHSALRAIVVLGFTAFVASHFGGIAAGAALVFIILATE